MRVARDTQGGALRAGLRHLLRDGAHHVVVETTSLVVLDATAATQNVDVAVVDAALVPFAHTANTSLDMPLIVVASTVAEALHLAADANVPRLLLAPVAQHDLYAALRASQTGDIYRPPSLAAPFRGSPLTPREQALVALQLQERTTGQIAVALGIEEQSVRASRARIYDKLGVTSPLGLQHWAETWWRSGGGLSRASR